jgi:hypothetical protein
MAWRQTGCAGVGWRNADRDDPNHFAGEQKAGHQEDAGEIGDRKSDNGQHQGESAGDGQRKDIAHRRQGQ